MNRRVVILFLMCSLIVLSLISILISCTEETVTPKVVAKASSSGDPRIHHFGDVSIDAGSQAMTHTFSLVNTSNKSVDIVAVKKTCGCLGAEVDRDTIKPGESAAFTVTLEVSATGNVMRGASVILSNEKVEHFSLTANGTTTRELRAFRKTPFVDESTHSIDLRAFLIKNEEELETAPLKVIEPKGIELIFHSWATVEQGSQEYGRPTKQSAEFTLNLQNYSGPYPARVTLSASNGAQCEVKIQAIPQLSSS